MKSTIISKACLAILLTGLVISTHAQVPENVVDTVELIRDAYQSERQEVVAEALQLTESEGAFFWPLYKAYRAEVEQVGDDLVKLALEYADLHPLLPEKRARAMLKDYLALERRLTDKRARYFKRAQKGLPATKVLRWAQLEQRMDLVFRQQMANAFSLVPSTPSKP